MHTYIILYMSHETMRHVHHVVVQYMYIIRAYMYTCLNALTTVSYGVQVTLRCTT